jgi:transposase
MIGTQERSQETLFIAGSLYDLIPNNHILKRVDRVLDLSWLREDVQESYCVTNGRPSIDPEAALRLMLAGFFHGFVHDRKLMREAQVNLAIRWFAGYRLDEPIPDHSSLTRIRQRWGAERFRKIFRKTVEMCIKENLVTGETVHTDATLIRADVSWESLTTEYAERVINENESGEVKKSKPKKRSITDPDATLSTSDKRKRLEPSYKQHTTVDDKVAVIVDVELTTGEASEGTRLTDVVERVESVTGMKVARVTADAGYAYPRNYKAMEDRGMLAVIPPPPERRIYKKLPLRLFKYDAVNNVVRCPGGKYLHPSHHAQRGWVYRAKRADCRACGKRTHCLSKTTTARSVLIVYGYEAFMRAKRARLRWDEETLRWYDRHRWKVEGVHGEAKTQHGLRRAVRRGMENVAIQVYLTAAVINLKRLAAFLLRRLGYLNGLKNGLYMNSRHLGLLERWSKSRCGIVSAA